MMQRNERYVTITYNGTSSMLPINTPSEKSTVKEIIIGNDNDNAAIVRESDFEIAGGR